MPPHLSIVIPAYNEETRLLPTILTIIDYLDRKAEQYEIIIVNDGSTDTTVDIVQKLQKLKPSVQLISLDRNSGKGAAVRKGVMQAQGQLILFIDADGATPFAEIEKLLSAINEDFDVAFGSRAMPLSDTKVISWFHRKFLGRIFNFFVSKLFSQKVYDTQCGFKLFKHSAAKAIFAIQSLDGFSFDVEVLFIANRLGMKIKEIPVNWSNVSGSKVNVILDGIKMFLDLIRIKLLHRKL
jgi:dolichyl-phosphate beta-glucosyltransferase